VKTTLGVGVIGLGEFGEKHLQAYRSLSGVQIVSVCSRSRERAEDVAHKFEAKRWTTDLRQLIADPEIDAVSVTTSEDRHLEPVLSAIEAGKHVFIEKPITTDLSDAQQMVEACSHADVTVMPGHIMRFAPRYVLVRDEIKRGALGKVTSMYARRNVARRPNIPMAGRAHPVFRTGVHDIDVALWYMDSPVNQVYCLDRNVQGREQPDMFWALLEFANGAIMCLESNWTVPRGAGIRSETVMEVIGTEGAAKIGPPTAGLTLMYEQDQFSPNTRWWPMIHGNMGGALRDEIQYFVECVLEGVKPSVVTMGEALETVRVAAAIVQSARSGKVVRL